MNKNILAILAAFACLSAEAAVTLYTWTGNGGDGRWNNSANWRIDGVGSGYPCVSGDDGHCVLFNKGSGTTTTVTLGSGETTISYIVVKSGTVILNGAADSVFVPVKSPQIDGNGFVVYRDAKLTVNTAVSCPSRLDKWRPGLLELTGSVNVDVAGFSFFLQEGGVTASGSAQLDFTGTVVIGHYNSDGSEPGSIATLTLNDSAKFRANAIYTTGNYTGGTSAANGRIVQNGEGSEVVLNVALGLLDCNATVSGEPIGATYELNGGRLVYKGGEPTLQIDAKSSLVFGGGTLCLTRSDIDYRPSKRLGVGDGAITYSGTSGVSLNSGRTFTWDWSGCDIASGTVFLHPAADTVEGVAMGGNLSFSGIKSTYGVGLEIGEGRTVTLAKNSSIVRPSNSYDPWKVVLDNGSVLKLAEATSRLALPLDLEVKGTGKIQMYSSTSGFGGGFRGAAVAHRLAVDGVEQAKGIYYANAKSFLDAGTAVGAAASIIVPYVWTGEGSDDNWTTAENWAGGAVPPSDSPVDLSRAETVTLDDNVSVTCLVAMPNSGARKTTVTGSGKLSLVCNANLSCGIFIPEGCELVLDVGFERTTSNVATMLGGGRLTLKKSLPTTAGAGPLLAVEGTIALAGEIELIPYTGSQYNWFMQVGVHPGGYAGEVLVEDGAEFTSDRLFESKDGFSNALIVRQTGGKATFAVYYMQNLNGATPSDSLKYVLDGGEMTVNGAINLGTSGFGSTMRYPGGSFEMTGGTLTCTGIKGGKNQNFVRLSGGDVNFTGGGYNEGFLSGTTMAATNKNDYTFYLGGVTLHANGSADTVFDTGDIVLTGENGDPVFDMATANFKISKGNAIIGTGGLVVTGGVGRVMTAGGTYRNTGSVVLRGGANIDFKDCTLDGPSRIVVEDANSVLTVYSPVGSSSYPCTILKHPDVIELAAASCLAVGGNQNLNVKRLSVGGTAYAPGTYTFTAGTVTVLGAPASWFANGVGDLSWEADGASESLAAGTGIHALTNAGAATSVSVAGNVVFESGANIHVAEGDTIILPGDVVISGEVTKTGAGEVVFNGAVTCTGTPGASNNGNWLLVKEGSATFDGAITGVAVATCGATTSPVVTLKGGCTVSDYGIVLTAYGKNGEKCYGETRQKGAILDYTGGHFLSGNMLPLAQPNGGAAKYVMDGGAISFATHVTLIHSSSEYGSFDFTQNGGTVTLGGGGQMYFLRNFTKESFTYTLAGGKFIVDAADPLASSSAANSVLNLNGGEIVFARQTAESYSPFADRAFFTVRVGGETVLDATGTPNEITLQNDFLSDGAEGKRSVKLKGGRFVVDGAVDTGLEIASGTATFTTGAARAMEGLMKLSIAGSGACAVLDYDGQMPVRTLKVGSSGRSKGVYSAVEGPNVVRAALDGTGELLVLVNSNSGTSIVLK